MTYVLPPLNALRAFEAAARHLSFKLAAHELHVTPAAVGQQVKALEAGGAISPEVDPAGLAGFLLWGSVPEPFTIRRAVRALPAGTYLEVEDGRIGAPVSWYRFDPRDPCEEPLEPAAAVEDSVRAHLVSDVPVAVFLSAGLDSGLLAALARRTPAAITTAIATTAALLVGGLRHRRGLGDGFVHVDDEVPQHRVAETECAGQVIEGLLVGLNVHQDVVGLVDLGERVGQLTASPVLEAMHVTVAGRDHALVALDHGGHLLALIRVHKENDFVMPHECSLRV